MLGRLRMSVGECIEEYIKLSSDVFQKTRVSPLDFFINVQARYSSKKLQTAIEEVVVRRLKDIPRKGDVKRNALLKDTSENGCKVSVVYRPCVLYTMLEADLFSFVCATSKESSASYLFRSYPPTRESPDIYEIATIWQASRATTAASSFFDPIKIGPTGQEFLDGGTGSNNPIRHLWNEAAEVFCGGSGEELTQRLRIIISIGTGVADLSDFGKSAHRIVATLVHMSTEKETTANEFHKHHSDLDKEGRYYRFNVAEGLAGIGLEEAKKAPRIKALTDQYLGRQSTHNAMTKCARVLFDPVVVPDQEATVPSTST
jgi:hypothetical protein